MVLNNGMFCMSALQESQSHVSDVFAGRSRTSDGNKFSCANWVPARSGSPRLINPLVAFDCRVSRVQLIGMHQVVFGDVADVFIAPGTAPLIYFDRDYGQLAKGGHAENDNHNHENSNAYDNAA